MGRGEVYCKQLFFKYVFFYFLDCVQKVDIYQENRTLPYFSSPRFPRQYSYNLYCFWILPASRDRSTVVYLIFYKIDLVYSSSRKSRDYLWITEWSVSNSATITDVFGDQADKRMVMRKLHTNKSPLASISFFSDYLWEATGFSASGFVSDEGRAYWVNFWFQHLSSVNWFWI